MALLRWRRCVALLLLLVGGAASEKVDLRVCSIFNLKHDALELMWHGVEYWQTLGVPVESLNYILASNQAHHLVLEVSDRLRAMGVPSSNVFVQESAFSVSRQYEWFRNCTDEAFRRQPLKNESVAWTSWMDADELPVWRSDRTGVKFSEMLGHLDDDGIEIYAGVMVDRASATGALVPVEYDGGLAENFDNGDNHKSLFEQFPVRCSLTNDVLIGASTKAIAFSAGCLDDSTPGCQLTPAHDGAHHLDNFMGFKCEPRRRWGELAHFKWTDDVLTKLCWRTRKFAFNNQNNFNLTSALAPPGPTSDETVFWHRESENMMHYLLQNDMRIGVDSSLCSRELPGGDYVRKGDGQIFDVRDVSNYVGLPRWQQDGVPCENHKSNRNKQRRASIIEIGGDDPDDSRQIVDEDTALQNFLKVCRLEKFAG